MFLTSKNHKLRHSYDKEHNLFIENLGENVKQSGALIQPPRPAHAETSFESITNSSDRQRYGELILEFRGDHRRHGSRRRRGQRRRGCVGPDLLLVAVEQSSDVFGGAEVQLEDGERSARRFVAPVVHHQHDGVGGQRPDHPHVIAPRDEVRQQEHVVCDQL